MSIRDRYPGPWRVEEIPAPGYRVVSANGVVMGYFYAESKGQTIQQLTMEEARAVAKAFASLVPDILDRQTPDT
ncbi:MAG: hypothetical protein KJZ83_00085 [Burkholderiaceae bacterium]|nr:hypothetical protein [Burkholderiaceae bacterium]